MWVAIADSFGLREQGCEATVIAQGLHGLICDLRASDTIRYDSGVSDYRPNPMDLDLLLTNTLDTSRAAVEAWIDLTHAPHLAIAAAESPHATLSYIKARDMSAFRWHLHAIPDPR